MSIIKKPEPDLETILKILEFLLQWQHINTYRKKQAIIIGVEMYETRIYLGYTTAWWLG